MNLLLYGNENGDEAAIDFEETSGNTQSGEFEGIVTQLMRWFTGTTSEAIQNWAESFMELTTCSSCNGARLKKKASGLK